jgi:RNA polymerase sigma factor (sigma-70 family)
MDCLPGAGTGTVAVMEESLDTWFKQEVLVHEPALLSYLARVWPRRNEILDLRQETYVRVYKAAASSRPHSARSFLFATARHLMTDRLRRERVVSIEAVGDIDALNVLVNEISAERCLSARQELKRLARAFDLLPPKCREVVWMRRVEELSHKEIAERLGINEKTVEKHVSKGARLLAEYMAADASRAEHASSRPEDEHDFGKP